MSSTLLAPETAAGDKESVLVLLVNRENRALMTEMLTSCDYVVTNDFPMPGDTPEATDGIDLCIVDGSSLHRYRADLQAASLAQSPIPLPVLLLTDRNDVGLVTRDVWRVVDDVVHRPVDKRALRARIETLIRGRRLALQVRKLSGLYERERHVAQRFQEAAMPRALPQIPGITFSAVYHPATNDARVGGDWYDAAQLPDGRVILSIGDVCGFGLDAAVAMANVRQVVRGVAQIHPDPATMLDAADRTLHAEDPDRIVTAFVGVFDPVTSLLAYASAGHPRPLVRHADGIVSELVAGGLPLGLPIPIAPRITHSATLPPGTLLVLYTDGVTEATHDLLAGEKRLREVVGDAATLDAANVAETIGAAVIPAVSNDDVAILTLAIAADSFGPDVLLRWAFDPSDASAAQKVRAEYIADLARGGVAERDLNTAELIFSELLGNVVRHAPGTVDVVLDRGTPHPVLHVLDQGPGFGYRPKLPLDLLCERGRGLFIVSELTEEFVVTERPGGGSHARAILSLDLRYGNAALSRPAA